MVRRLALVLFAVTACGRVGFDGVATRDGDIIGSDAMGSDDASQGSGSVTLVQVMSGRATNQTVGVGLALEVLPGDVMVVGVDCVTVPGVTLTISDARDSGLTQIMGPVGDSQINEWLFVGTLTNAGADSIFVTPSMAGTFEVRVHVLRGLQPDIVAAPTDVASGVASAGDPIASPALAAPAGSLIVGFGVAETTLEVGSGFTVMDGDFGDLTEYAVATTAGTATATATELGAGDWVMSIAALPLQ